MSARWNLVVGVFAGIALWAGIAVILGCRSDSDDPNRLRIEIARMEAEVQVDSKAIQTGWLGSSDARTRAGNLAALKERLRQIEERRRELDLNWQLAPRL